MVMGTYKAVAITGFLARIKSHGQPKIKLLVIAYMVGAKRF